MRSPRPMPRLAFVLLVAALAAGACDRPAPPPPSAAVQPGDTSFAALVARLSEPGGYFDTDNLISNERAYLHVMGTLDRLGVRGGAYIGVGPDQNFSYIAAIRPEVVFLIDIRRDNLLQHLLYRALFELAENRAEYLALWLGRPISGPAAPEAPRGEVSSEPPIEALVTLMDRTPADAAYADSAAGEVRRRVVRYGVPLSVEDLDRIRSFHAEFVRHGLDLRFTSHGRGPRPGYPTLRDLLLETDLAGERRGYMADEEAFRFVRRMQRDGRIVPVVGDLAGEHALAAIGREVERRGLVVSAFYTSNVEFYLAQDGVFERYAETTSSLPRDRRSVIIRSVFDRSRRHPASVPGYLSAQLVQTMDAFARGHRDGRWWSYGALLSDFVTP